MPALPLVSVVIPFFNPGPFLEEAIASVLAQTYSHWELLLVDDGSTDVSTQIGRRYAATYPGRVTYIGGPDRANRGLPLAGNIGLQHARGELVAPLYADDVWLPRKLQQQTATLAAHTGAGMVCGATQDWFGWTGQPADAARDRIRAIDVQPGSELPAPRLLASILDRRAKLPCLSNVLIRRDALDRIGGFVEAFVGDNQVYAGDAVIAKLAMHVPVVVSGECWDRRRQHRASMHDLLARSGGLHRARRFFLEWLSFQCTEAAVTDAELWRGLRSEMRSVRYEQARAILSAVRRRLTPARRALSRALRSSSSPYDGGIGVSPRVEDPFARLRRLAPLDRGYGWNRGLPIDRYYIERFLQTHAPDIRGRVLEVADRTYTTRFGGDRVEVSDVLHAAASNPLATLVADLTCADAIPSGAFDCVILTQTLPFIYDPGAAVREVFRILKPGGVVLATVPGISPIIRKDMAAWGDYWRFTSRSARRLFEHVFPIGSVMVEAHGNVMTAVGFLHGIASGELAADELNHGDPDYEVLITIRAVKPAEERGGRPRPLHGVLS
jgi:glycosyltransferase involved in cell wall biosynthesis